MLTLRPEVQLFARAMEEKLRKNDHKGGWDDMTPGELLRRIEQETAELRGALETTRRRWIDGILTGEDRVRIRREAADVANFAMMIADVCGALPEGGETP